MKRESRIISAYNWNFTGALECKQRSWQRTDEATMKLQTTSAAKDYTTGIKHCETTWVHCNTQLHVEYVEYCNVPMSHLTHYTRARPYPNLN